MVAALNQVPLEHTADQSGGSGNATSSPEQLREVLRGLSPIDETVARIRGDLVVALALRTEVAPLPPRPRGAAVSIGPSLFLQGEDGRVAMTQEVLTTFAGAHLNQPDTVRGVLMPLTTLGLAAVLAAAADLAGTADPSDFETNTLTWLGNRVSYHLRRALLLRELEAADWNLTVAAKALRVGGAGALSRTIRDLGLSDVYAAARKRGAGKPGPKSTRP